MRGRRVAVIGAGGAIGTATCAALRSAGAEVIAADIDADAARAAAGAAGAAGAGRADSADVTDPEAVAALAGRLEGPLDGMVYAAGIAFTAALGRIDWGAYRRLMAVNLDGAFHCCQAFAPALRASASGGAVVLISSMAGLRGEAGAAAYSASKFGLIGLAESFAAESTGTGPRVNALCPGNVDSPLLRQVAGDISRETGEPAETVHAAMARVGSARRLVRPDEVAGAALWLLSPAAGAVTGAALRVDAGGMVG